LPQTIRTLVLDETGSTNREALARAAEGEAGPLWIMARRQTAGRGRSGRSWVSERGNLYATLLTRIACPPAAIAQISLVTGVAVHDAVVDAARRVPPGLRLKWPNDVLIGRAKCAGILAESVLGQNTATVAIGVGINLAWHPGDLGREATHLAAHGIDVSPEAMLELLAAAMDGRLTEWDGGAEFAATRAAWLERAGPEGEACSVNMGAESIAGAYAGLDDSGALLIVDDTGRRRTVAFGDVSLPAAAKAGAA
jgi:BirA family transcriptional regulator, biotin operon repressor / biotin---[acetyl-CoA-carboxylase] ligase